MTKKNDENKYENFSTNVLKISTILEMNYTKDTTN